MFKKDYYQNLATIALRDLSEIKAALNIKSDPLSIYPENMTKANICAAFGVSGSTVERMAASGKITKIQAAKGKTTTYPKDEVRACFTPSSRTVSEFKDRNFEAANS